MDHIDHFRKQTEILLRLIAFAGIRGDRLDSKGNGLVDEYMQLQTEYVASLRTCEMKI